MVPRILLIILVCIVAANGGTNADSEVRPFSLEAIIQDTGNLFGAPCKLKTEKCTKYKSKVCKLIQDPLKALLASYTCDVTLLSDRNDANQIKVKVEVQLKSRDSSPLVFDPTCPTLAVVLNEAYVKLLNTPKASVFLTNITTPINPLPTFEGETFTFQMVGTVYKDGSVVAPSKWRNKQTCTLQKNLEVLDLQEEILDVMYKYATKRLGNVTVEKKDESVLATVNVAYPRDFFVNMKLNPLCDFVDLLQSGFRSVISASGYHFGPDVNLKVVDDAVVQGPETYAFEIKATTPPDGKFKGSTCTNPDDPCLAYRAKMCAFVKKPLICGLVPASSEACAIQLSLGTEPQTKAYTAQIKLELIKNDPNLYSIDLGCPTFGALYKMTLDRLNSPDKLTIDTYPGSDMAIDIPSDLTVFQVSGQLMMKNKPVQSSELDKLDLEELQEQLKNLQLPDKLLQTVYTSGNPTVLEPQLTTIDNQVIIKFMFSYPKEYFVQAGINPRCNLVSMFEWGFRNAVNSSGYHFAQDSTVKLVDPFVFKAIIQDTRNKFGSDCKDVNESCVEFKHGVCEFVGGALKPMEMALCLVSVLSSPTQDNKREVSLAILPKRNNGLEFSTSCPTFIAALNQSLRMWVNKPNLNMQLTEAVNSVTGPMVIRVSGTLFKDGNPVEPGSWKPKNSCPVEVKLVNLGMTSYLLKSMYTYATKRFTDFAITTADNKTTAEFEVTYPEEFFTQTGMSPQCDFADQLQWGFRNPSSTSGYYMGSDTTVAVVTPATEITDLKTNKFSFTATVKSVGTMQDTKCKDLNMPCLGYKKRLCQYAQKPFICGLAPPATQVCDIDLHAGQSEDELNAHISIQLSDTGLDVYPINLTCPTFGALYRSVFQELYEDNALEVTHLTNVNPPNSEIPETIEFLVTGQLYRKNKLVSRKQLEGLYVFDAFYDLAYLEMPDQLLQAGYTYADHNLHEFTTNLESNTVSFKLSYSKTALEHMGVDPTCNFDQMLQWGFQKTVNSGGYHLGSDATVKTVEDLTTTTVNPREYSIQPHDGLGSLSPNMYLH